MKKAIFRLRKQVMAGILCLILVQCPVFFAYAESAGLGAVPTGLYAAGAVLMDADSGRVLFSKSGDEFYPMASTTKILTCILALELGSPDQIVTFSSYAASMPDVQMNAKPGEQYYLKDLLYSTMLESHNDSAVAVAEAIGGDVKSFTDLMNRKAEAIGCLKAHFVTPNGLDGADEGGEHGITAKELALILRYCISISSKAEEFIEITKAPSYEFEELNGKRHVYCSNHNALLNSYEGAFTGKTGFTGKAGYCYTGAVKKDERYLIIALLGAGWYPHKSYKWKDAKKLLDYGFENYYYADVGEESWELPEIKVTDGMEKTVPIFTDAGTFPYLLREEEKPVCRVEYAKELQAPVTKNTVVGTITYELDGIVIEQFQIYAGEDVDQSTFWNVFRRWLRKIQDFVRKLTNKPQNA